MPLKGQFSVVPSHPMLLHAGVKNCDHAVRERALRRDLEKKPHTQPRAAAHTPQGYSTRWIRYIPAAVLPGGTLGLCGAC